MRVKEIVWGGILTCLALVIPLSFGGVLGITIPPFSATLASHVPVMLSMLISPLVAFMVAAGSALGFLIKLGPVIGARAAMHIIFAVMGALMFRRGLTFKTVLLTTLPVHALSEALIVLLFGFTLHRAGVVVGIGTALHHGVDSMIALTIYAVLKNVIPNAAVSSKELQN